MPSYFVAYETTASLIDPSDFEATVSELGEVLIIQDALIMLRTTLTLLVVQSILAGIAEHKVRFTLIPAFATASFTNSRPGIFEAFKGMVNR